MKRQNIIWLLLSLVLLSSLLAACAGGAPAVTPQVKGAEVPRAVQNQWDEIVAAAQKEGTVNIYDTEMAAAVAPLREAFAQKYKINLEFTLARTAEITAKINAERRGGVYMADVLHVGETTAVMDVKPMGITQPLPDLLVLPEVKNPANWAGGKLPYLDKDQHVLMFMAMSIPHGVVSTELVKEGDLTSLLDILKPQWKGKIVFSDPTISGTSPNLLAVMVKTFGKERAMEAFRQLAAQEPVITRDSRQLLEWVARGKYAIGLGQSMALFSEFKRIGAPITVINLKEPRMISAGPSCLIVLSNNPHPKATQVYVNWLLSKEGSSVWSKALAYASTRVDVPNEGLDPANIPLPHDVFPDEEQLQLRVEMRKAAADIFGALMK